MKSHAKQETVYITTNEGLRSAMREVFREFNLIKSSSESTKPTPPATRQQGADFLGLSLPTFDTLLRTNQIKSFRIGRQVRVNWSELEAYLNKKGAASHG